MRNAYRTRHGSAPISSSIEVVCTENVASGKDAIWQAVCPALYCQWSHAVVQCLSMEPCGGAVPVNRAMRCFSTCQNAGEEYLPLSISHSPPYPTKFCNVDVSLRDGQEEESVNG